MHTSKWLDEKQIERAQKFVHGYYQQALKNRKLAVEGGALQLENVQGKVLLYWLEGSQDHMAAIWNFRQMNPPHELILNGNHYVLRSGGPPCPSPDVNDAILFDVTEDELFSYILAEFDEAWVQPLNQKRYRSPEAFLAQSLNNICRGDIPYDLYTCTAEMRAKNGWDAGDRAEASFVQLGAHVYPTTTAKQRTLLDIALAHAGLVDCPEYADQSCTTQIGTYNAEFRPTVYDRHPSSSVIDRHAQPMRSRGEPVNGFADSPECDAGVGQATQGVVIEFPGRRAQRGGAEDTQGGDGARSPSSESGPDAD